MNTEQALNILVQSVLTANKRGAFELAESKIIAEAVEVFTKKPDGTNTTVAGDSTETKEEVHIESEKSSKES